MEISFYSTGKISDEKYHFAVICASCNGRWIFARHRDRETWEVPGGHREKNEDIGLTASRELFEETGALGFELEPVCDYSVASDGVVTFGRLFYAEVTKIGSLPESEISEVVFLKELPERLTYPEIQPLLFDRVLRLLKGRFLELLESDVVRNINMMNFIKNYPVYSFDRAGSSALIRGKSDEEWVYISSGSQKEFLQLAGGLDDMDKCFAVLEDWMLPYIAGEREVRSRLSSIKFVYDGETALPCEKHRVTGLTPADAPYIYENSEYRDYISIGYIEDRIRYGISAGIRLDGRLVAWALTHDDGAVGFLNVLEDFRERGCGTDVTVAVMKRQLKAGELPFVHIEESNVKSVNLAVKAGFRPDRRIHWLKLA